MSVTKSFVGTLAALLAHDGSIKPEALVTDYLPAGLEFLGCGGGTFNSTTPASWRRLMPGASC